MAQIGYFQPPEASPPSSSAHTDFSGFSSSPEDAHTPSLSQTRPEDPISDTIFEKKALETFENWLLLNRTKVGQSLLDAPERAIYIAYLLNDKFYPIWYDSNDPKSRQKWATMKHLIKNGFKLGSQNMLLREVKGRYLPQAFIYNTARYIESAHTCIGHGGIRKTYDQLCSTAYGIPRIAVTKLLPHCKVCLKRRRNNSKAPLQPIYSDYVLERIQIDLMDFRDRPSGGYLR